MLSTHEMIDKLEDLMRLDVDAVSAYTAAIERIDDKPIRERLGQFGDDHERHIRNLQSAIRSVGGRVPRRSRDFKGFFIEGMTAIRSDMGTDSALKAMRTNEKLMNSRYSGAVEWDVPTDLRTILAEGYADERRHLEYVEQQLSLRKAA